MAKSRKKINRDALERAAFHYLSRYSTSAGHLRRILWRKIDRLREKGEEIPPPAGRWIAEVVEKCIELGLVDDAAFGAGRIRALLMKGKSLRQIRADLLAKRLDGELVDRLIEQEAGADGAGELAAAVRFARRRRFGPFAPERRESAADDRARREKAIAAFSRAGFPYPLARLILDCESIDELEALMD